MERRWDIDPRQSKVSICASSTLHDSRSSGVGLTGRLHGDPDDLESTAGGSLTVPLKKQTFGDRMRDFAMHRHIDVKRWPDAAFEVAGVEVLSRDPWRIQVSGEITYRDRKTPLTVEATGSLDDDALRANASFALDLPALGIAPPRLLFMKVGDKVDVDVEIVAKGTP